MKLPKKIPPHVWIVEMWNAERNRWEPTVDANLSRDDARIALLVWRADWLPEDRFRLAKYARV